MYACTDIGCCGSTITPHPTLKSSHDRDDNYEDNDENVDDGDEARHKLRRASYRSAHVRAYVSRLIFKERDFMTIFIRGLVERVELVREETGRNWRQRWNWQAFYEWAPVNSSAEMYMLILTSIRFIPDGKRRESIGCIYVTSRRAPDPIPPTRRNRADVRLNDSFVGLVRSLFLHLLHDPQARRRAAEFPRPTFIPRWKLVRNSPARQCNFALSA